MLPQVGRHRIGAVVREATRVEPGADRFIGLLDRQLLLWGAAPRPGSDLVRTSDAGL